MNICKIDRCERKVFGYGMCQIHYRKWVKWGDPLKRSRNDLNEIIIKEDCATIIIYNRNGFAIGETLIDVDDVPRVRDIKWGIVGEYIHGCNHGKIGFLHNFIMNNIDKKFEYDHINRNKWDNRKDNLRISNHALNKFNQEPSRNNTSGYKGVSKKGNKWSARIKYDGKYRYVGFFDDKVSAAIAYNEAAQKNIGEHAWLNPI